MAARRRRRPRSVARHGPGAQAPTPCLLFTHSSALERVAGGLGVPASLGLGALGLQHQQRGQQVPSLNGLGVQGGERAESHPRRKRLARKHSGAEGGLQECTNTDAKVDGGVTAESRHSTRNPGIPAPPAGRAQAPPVPLFCRSERWRMIQHSLPVCDLSVYHSDP